MGTRAAKGRASIFVGLSSTAEDRMRTLSPGPLVEASGMGLRACARRLGVDPAVLCRPLSDAQADRYAVALGLTPEAVWGLAAWLGEGD
jgi:hypothetical protein